MGEVWVPVVGYEETYEVSNQGNIRRVARGRGSMPGRLKRLSRHAQGYLTVTLHSQGKGRSFLVHRVVATAFHRPIASGEEINHLNGVKDDNRPENLQIVWRQENIDHAVAAGLINNKGERNSQAKITAELASRILADHASGLGYKLLARKYGVTWGLARSVAARKTWRHLRV